MQVHKDLVQYCYKIINLLQIYAWIEEEMLVILYGTKKFNHNVFCLDITVESDHKFLEVMLLKSLFIMHCLDCSE